MNTLVLGSSASPPPIAAKAAAEACFHCGLPVPSGTVRTMMFQGVTHPMCCAGCEAVARTILDAGLEDYYLRRTAPSSSGAQLDEMLARAQQWEGAGPDTAQPSTGDAAQARLYLDGITCSACAWLAERVLQRVPGVARAEVNVVTHVADVAWDASRTNLAGLSRALASVGLSAAPAASQASQQARQSRRRRDAWELGIAAFSMMQAMMFTVPFYFAAPGEIDAGVRSLMNAAAMLVTLPAVFFSGRRFLAGAWRDLTQRHVSMDTPIAVAILATFGTSLAAMSSGQGATYFDSIGMFITLLLAARWFETGLRDAALDRIERLTNPAAGSATRLDGSADAATETRVPVASIQPGDRLRVRSGEAVPVDATPLDPASEWNEAVLSGEAAPVCRPTGATVPAGALNAGADVTVTALRRASESTLARIGALTESLLAGRRGTSAASARWARFVAPASLLLALAGALLWLAIDPARSFDIAVAVLAITCPCALALAAPSVTAGAQLAMSRSGWLVAQPDAAMSAHQVTDVVFDKTGTLTEGRLALGSIETFDAATDESAVLSLAAALESGSAHPIAAALTAACVARGLAIPAATRISAHPGQGVSGVVDGRDLRFGQRSFALDGSDTPDDPAYWLACKGKPLARFAVTDPVRADARDTVAALGRRGIRVWIASGDSAEAVTTVAQATGVSASQARSRLSPEAKADLVDRLTRDGARVALVGDGVNDAPAMARASLSVALAGGADLPRIHADAILLGSSLRAIVRLVETTARAARLTRQNLAWAVAYNALAIPAALAGLVSPAWAAIGMSASSLLVILNALRATRVRPVEA